jgi:hypothetical protein
VALSVAPRQRFGTGSESPREILQSYSADGSEGWFSWCRDDPDRAERWCTTNTLTPDERRARALRRSLHRIPLRDAEIRAELLTLELGGPTAPIAADAWRLVRQREIEFRHALARDGLTTPRYANE